ncbi:MAG: 3-hydroxybutyryl-CoA dehydrogenase, partial [Pseudomonadota bacterium]
MIEKIAVVGAGQMGNGIAQVCATSGADVWLIDVSEAQLENAISRIDKNLTKLAERQKLNDATPKEILARIHLGTDIAACANAALIIEAASEQESLKCDIFRAIVPHLGNEAVLATNTSSISVTRLAAVTNRPAQFCGVHFMNPVHIMPLVELIRGLGTSAETFSKMEEFATTQLGKTVAVAEDFPGFIVNRILLPMINEAVYALYEGVGNVTAIDTAMKLGTRHPMGPLQLADFVGLDTCLAIMNVLHQDLADSKYRPCPLLVKYVEAGWLGTKSGRGFYDYSGDTPIP